jgi:hypothetical protein
MIEDEKKEILKNIKKSYSQANNLSIFYITQKKKAAIVKKSKHVKKYLIITLTTSWTNILACCPARNKLWSPLKCLFYFNDRDIIDKIDKFKKNVASTIQKMLSNLDQNSEEGIVSIEKNIW